MSTPEITFIVIAIPTLIIGAYVLMNLLDRFMNRASTPHRSAKNLIAGRARVGRLLSRFGKIRGYKAFGPVALGGGEADYILAGYFGLLVVTVAASSGDFYGEADQDKWLRSYGGFREYFENPSLRGRRAVRDVRKLLSDNRLFRVPVTDIVVFTGAKADTNIYVTGVDNIVHVDKLRRFLSSPDFEKDSGVDLKRVEKLLSELTA